MNILKKLNNNNNNNSMELTTTNNTTNFSSMNTDATNYNNRGKTIKKIAPKKVEKKQDQKAAKTLSAILLAFIITWTPYNINVVVNTFCNNCLDKFAGWQFFGELNFRVFFVAGVGMLTVHFLRKSQVN